MKNIKYFLVVFSAIVMLCGVSVGLLTNYKSKNNVDNAPQIETSVDFSNLTYSAIGDSITIGACGNRGYTNDYMPNPYPEVVGNILGLKRKNNYGIGGSTVSSFYAPMCERYKNISLQSNIISVMGGCNDAREIDLGTIDSFDTSTFMGAYNVLLTGLLEKYPNAFIFICTLTQNYKQSRPDYNTNTFGYKPVDFYNATLQLAEKYNLPVLDCWNLDGIIENTQTTDGVHPDQIFVNDVLAPHIAQFIKDNYKK